MLSFPWESGLRCRSAGRRVSRRNQSFDPSPCRYPIAEGVNPSTGGTTCRYPMPAGSPRGRHHHHEDDEANCQCGGGEPHSRATADFTGRFPSVGPRLGPHLPSLCPVTLGRSCPTATTPTKCTGPLGSGSGGMTHARACRRKLRKVGSSDGVQRAAETGRDHRRSGRDFRVRRGCGGRVVSTQHPEAPGNGSNSGRSRLGALRSGRRTDPRSSHGRRADPSRRELGPTSHAPEVAPDVTASAGR
jgi:hypothetical protein